MARYKYALTEKRIEQWIKEGRGQGIGENYNPWIEVQNFPSKGNVYRVNGVGVPDRVRHLFSQLEYHWYLIFELDSSIVDIREQFPLLPRGNTIELAKSLQIPHPAIKGQNMVITSDFRITTRQKDGSHKDTIYSIKYEKDLKDNRVREKMKLEKAFWKKRGINFFMNTDTLLKEMGARVDNALLLRGYHTIQDRLQISDKQLWDLSTFLTEQLEFRTDPPKPILDKADRLFGLLSGSSLTVFYYLIARRVWLVDKSKPINIHYPFTLKKHRLEILKSLINRGQK